jgi:hypothetical protein
MLYYLLVEDSILHLSIGDIFNWASHFAKLGHLIVIGFLPIYLGLLIFGVAILIIYLRSSLCPSLFHYVKRWIHIERK